MNKNKEQRQQKAGRAGGQVDAGVMPLDRLRKNDIVSLRFGFNRLIARILCNTGGYIVWHSLSWLEESAESFSYSRCEKSKMIYIGKYRPFLRRLFTLNFSKVDYVA